MSASFHGTAALDAPFPGLRAFEAEESLLFYGREAHVAELLDRLDDTRFVAVTGTSGSGKSSLVKAGLRPALDRGYLVDATTRWRFATMRPGRAPIQALAESLAGVLDAEPLDAIVRSLGATSAGLSQVVGRSGLARGESLLVIADQFEELFRYDVTRDQQANASLFVSLLLEAAAQRDAPIYVVVTMRSEFLGRCSEFTGLAEAFNRSQYLVPRLTRDERREAIERPLKLFGTVPSPALVQQVLNDVGDDPDQLPVLQHVLLRTYRQWQRAGGTGKVEREHYDAAGGIERALDGHGEEILSRLSAAAQKITETLFRSLTVAQGGVALRRPRRMRELYDVSGASDPEARRHVDEIVNTFADRENSFLMLSSRTLTPETMVDITHESLIRKWKRLAAWVREEARSAEWYSDLSRDVIRYRNREVSLWQDPELAGVQRRRRDEGWNEAWANQYRRTDDPAFSEVLSFVDESAREQSERLREEEKQRDRELRQAQALARANRRQSIALALVLVGVGIVAFVLYRSVQKDRQIAQATSDYQRATEENQRQLAKVNALEAEQAALKRSAATASPADQARLDQLTKEIDGARAQAKGSQDELAKLRKDQELGASDRGGLLKQIDALRQEKTQAINERDKLQAQLNAVQKSQYPTQSQSPQPDDRAATLQRQLDDERKRATDALAEVARLRNENAALRSSKSDPTPTPPASNVSVQDLTKAFSDGVRAYDLKNWGASAQSMRDATRMQSGVKEPPKEVRMSGTRFVPYAPWSYLAAALSQFAYTQALQSPGGAAKAMDAVCTDDVNRALTGARAEPAPPDIKPWLSRVQAVCGGR